MVDSVQTHMTAAEFFDLPESNLPVELIQGELVVSPTPIPFHQDIVGNTFVILREAAQHLGGKAYHAPLDVYLDEANVVQPDVLWIAPESRCQITDTHLEGAPDLIVEVLTARHDKTVKFHLYEQHGVREYWILDPVPRLLEIWQLSDQQFTRQGIYGIKDTLESPVLAGKTITVEDLFQN